MNEIPKIEQWMKGASGEIAELGPGSIRENIITGIIAKWYASHVPHESPTATQGQADKLRLLASAMKKVLPPALLQELIDHCDPFSAFMREMQDETPSPHAPQGEPQKEKE